MERTTYAKARDDQHACKACYWYVDRECHQADTKYRPMVHPQYVCAEFDPKHPAKSPNGR